MIVGQIKRSLTKEEAETFYAEHRGKVFFEKLVNFMTSGGCDGRDRTGHAAHV